MRMYTVTYDHRGRVATATVQGDEVTTMHDLLCIREDGRPLATFPKRDVLHVTSNGPGDERAAAAVENVGMPIRGPLAARAEHREASPARLRHTLDPNSLLKSTARAVRRPQQSPARS